MRATTGEAYTDGRGMFRPAEVRVERGSRIPGERVVRADVCVIGTGAGGAPVAKELAEGGMRVVMLEEGERFTPDDMTARPGEMTTVLYRDAGQTVTVGNVPITLPLGKTVGGSTLVNSGTCFRTPAAVLELWAERFGLEQLTPDALDPFFRRVERELNVAQVTPELAGRNAAVVKRGADALGWHGDFIFRNAKGCVGSGVCAFGCPTAAKQHTGQVYVPKAWDAGRHDLQRLPGHADPGRGRPRPRCRGPNGRRRHGARGERPGGRGLRRDPHAAVPAPQRARRRVRRARPQPGDPPGHGGPGAVRRGDRHGPRRAAVVLHRRVRRRGDHVRGSGGPARLHRDGLPVLARAAPRGHAELPATCPSSA